MDLRIDPLTGDYDGTRCTDLGNAVYLRIKTPRGAYWGDSKFGSRLHLLQRAKDLKRNQGLAVQYAQEALQPLIDDKRADHIDISSEWNHDGRLVLLGEVFQSGRLLTKFKHYVGVA